MNDKDTLYARMLSNDLSQSEIEDLKATGVWEEIESIAQLMDEVELPPLDKQKGLDTLKDKISIRKDKLRRLNQWRNIGVAASILILVGLFVLQRFNGTTLSADLVNTESYQFIDNSTVMLNDGSKISFDEDNWDKRREIKLTGEAFFQVQKGSPFIVETGKGSIEVLGTSFNIKSWGNALEVTCYSGKVRVVSRGETLILSKGEKVYFKNGKKGMVQNHNDSIPSWINEISSFYGEDLNMVFDELERQFGVEIISPDFDKKFTGTFTHDTLDKALYQICTPMGITYTIDLAKNKVMIIGN